MSEELFEIVLNKAQDFLKQKGIEIVSEKTLMAALPLVIECVETVKNKETGEEKKALALRVLLFIVKESGIDDEKKMCFVSLSRISLETTIDIIVDASKGKFELNRKTKRKLFVCMSQCLETVGEYATRVPIRRSEVKTEKSSTKSLSKRRKSHFQKFLKKHRKPLLRMSR